MSTNPVLDLLRDDLQRAVRHYEGGLAWLTYTVETKAQHYRLPIAADLDTRRWWFVLRVV